MKQNALLPFVSFLPGFLAALLTISVTQQSLAAAQRDPDLIRRENSKPGARDWQLTRVPLVSNTSVRAAYIEGY